VVSIHSTAEAMKTKLIRIGNSQGVRIPKPLIEESGLTEEIEMILRDNEIVLRSAETIRKSWEASFKKIAEQGDDALLDQKEIEKPSEWDEAEWTW
jgi:antitoxin MazE